MLVNAIYSTFNGEMNPHGIGSLTIFLRLQGCHIRCYKRTLGVLCDTPEALARENPNAREMAVKDVVEELKQEREKTGINLICLTGGDPLWHNHEELHQLFALCDQELFEMTVETSGTLDWTPFAAHEHVSFIVDYKLKSAGLKAENMVKKYPSNLRPWDFVKFVVYDEADYQEMTEALPVLAEATEAKITVGVYWGGKILTFELFDRLKEDNMLQYLSGGINFQAHKLVLNPNSSVVVPALR